jgi:hypothetical protein
VITRPLWQKNTVIIFPFAMLFLIYILREQLIHLGTLFPACPSYTYLHIYCPGCGNTRSVQHLLTGDLASSVKYNPFPLIGLILAVLFYIEIITFVFGKHKRIITRNRSFWWTFTILMSFYFIIRNFVKPF